MIHKSKSIIVALFLLSFCGVNAQQNTVSSGGNATGSGGTVSYSIGQIDYITSTGSTGMATQGVQQPYEIYSVGIDEPGIDLTLSAYPNPSTDFISLQFENYMLQNSIYQLADMNGKVLESNKIITNQTRICLDNLAPATYFLKVKTETKELKLFKIIKL